MRWLRSVSNQISRSMASHFWPKGDLLDTASSREPPIPPNHGSPLWVSSVMCVRTGGIPSRAR